MAVTHPVKVMDPDQNYYGETKTKVPSLQKATSESFGNFHANHLNTGKDDTTNELKKSRMLAMKRRMSQAY